MEGLTGTWVQAVPSNGPKNRRCLPGTLWILSSVHPGGVDRRCWAPGFPLPSAGLRSPGGRGGGASLHVEVCLGPG